MLIRYLDNSVDLWAEASPLPGFSSESMKDVSSLLTEKLTSLNTFFTSDFTIDRLKRWLETCPSIPSIQYALSYLGIRISLHRNKNSTSSILPFSASPSVQINDIVGMKSPDEVLRHIRLSRSHGFTTFKCKAGKNSKRLAKLLKTIADKHRDIRFRVDANQSWPVPQLKDIGVHFEGLPIEYAEEPAGYHSIDELRNNITALGLPVALDESIQTFDQLTKVKSAVPDVYIVIKPALYGNIFTLAETICALPGRRKKVVFSTLLESRIGRDMTLFCASYMGDPMLAHGLNTGHLLKEDLMPDFDIRNGKIETGTQFRSRGEPVRFNFLNALNGIHS